MHRRELTTLLAGILSLGSVAALHADAAGWRSNPTGAYPDADPPLDWADQANIVWSKDMPAWSNATPIVADGRVFTLAEPNTLICVDAATGDILWQKPNTLADAGAAGDDPPTHPTNGYTSATPTTDGRHVYAFFGNGVAAAYDLDGNRAWISRVQSPTHDWGNSTSPVLIGDTLVVTANDMFGLNPATGEVKWTVNGQQCWGSPVAANVGGRDILISPLGQLIDPANGEVLGKIDAKLEYNSPIYQDGIVYFIYGNAGAFKLAQQDDGTIAITEVWGARIAEDRYYASPLLHDGLIYAVTQQGEVSIIDAKGGTVEATGSLAASDADADGLAVNDARGAAVFAQPEGGDRRRGQGRRRRGGRGADGGGVAYSSPILAGGHIFFARDSGAIDVYEAGSQLTLVEQTQIEALRSTPVVADNRIYVRTRDKLMCLSKPDRTAMID